MRGALYHLLTAQAMDYFLMLLVLLSCVEVRGWAGDAGAVREVAGRSMCGRCRGWVCLVCQYSISLHTLPILTPTLSRWPWRHRT